MLWLLLPTLLYAEQHAGVWLRQPSKDASRHHHHVISITSSAPSTTGMQSRQSVSCGPVHWTAPNPERRPVRQPPPRDAPLRFASAASSPHAAALHRAAHWLEAHMVQIDSELLSLNERGGGVHQRRQNQLQQHPPLLLVAWWDPSLAPTDAGALVAYTLSDNLWAQWALRQLAPETSANIKASLCVHRPTALLPAILRGSGKKIVGFAVYSTALELGQSSNGFFDQTFHVLSTFRGHANNTDNVHGRILATAPCSGTLDGASNLSVAIRHFDYVKQPHAVDLGMAGAFVDFGVQYAFHSYWRGDIATASAIILAITQTTHPPDGGGVWFCSELGLVLDKADAAHYAAWRSGAPMIYCPYKQALFMLAARSMGLVEGGSVPKKIIRQLEQRIVEAQARDGSYCNFVRLDKHGVRLPLPKSHCGTAETTSIVMLALLAQTSNATVDSSSRAV